MNVLYVGLPLLSLVHVVVQIQRINRFETTRVSSISPGAHTIKLDGFLFHGKEEKLRKNLLCSII